MKPKTNLIGSPFAALLGPTPPMSQPKQSAPKLPRKQRPAAKIGEPGSGRVDPATLEIDLEAEYDPNWKAPRPPGKYDAIFSQLPVGRSVKCKPEDCNTIAHALRTWGKLQKRNLDVRLDKNFRGTGEGRVFLLGDKNEPAK